MTFLRLAPLLALALLALPLRAQDDSPGFVVRNEIIPSPAGPGATAPCLINAPDGSVSLSWLEPAPAGHTALRFSRFDPATRTWSPARTIAESLSADIPSAQTPDLAVGTDGRLAALWQPTPALTLLSTSTDGGANWSLPVPLNRPHHVATHAILRPLPDGQLLAVWIEPGTQSGTLLARTTDPQAKPAVVDPSVSPGCTPALAVFPDGSALAAYRGLTADGIEDIFAARFHDGRWDTPARLGFDDWKPAAPPGDGPALVARGPHVAAAWFTASPDARVNVSTSDNAGAQWLIANRVDDVAPLGRPDLVLFDDGSLLVSWVEKTGPDQIILLRRISARGNLSVPVQVAPVAEGARPVIARVKDGDTTPAEVLIAYLQPTSPLSAQPSAPHALVTRLVTLPAPSLLAETDPCDCDPRPEDLRGYPIKGRIVSIDAAHGTLQLDHVAILGVMNAGKTVFQAGPEVLRVVQPDSAILARIERTGPDWTLFNVSVLETPQQLR